jgi:hypothetical protein
MILSTLPLKVNTTIQHAVSSQPTIQYPIANISLSVLISIYHSNCESIPYKSTHTMFGLFCNKLSPTESTKPTLYCSMNLILYNQSKQSKAITTLPHKQHYSRVCRISKSIIFWDVNTKYRVESQLMF